MNGRKGVQRTEKLCRARRGCTCSRVAAETAKPAEPVRLGGTLQPLPSEEQMIDQWQLDPAVARNLTRNEALYIRADSLIAAGC